MSASLYSWDILFQILTMEHVYIGAILMVYPSFQANILWHCNEVDYDLTLHSAPKSSAVHTVPLQHINQPSFLSAPHAVFITNATHR